MANSLIGIQKPYYRIYRANQLYDGYILDRRYAPDRNILCRVYKIIEEDLLNLFQYIEPSDENQNVFSHRTYELLLRSATEFETNCKLILHANSYKKRKGLNIEDYRKIDQATKLSEYEVKCNIWHPSGKILQPFLLWRNSGQQPLLWYQDYNKVKHDRFKQFQKASLINVVNSVSAVLAVLYAQFSEYIFSLNGNTWDDESGFEYSDSTLFGIKPFRNWSVNESYTFKWPNKDANPFQSFRF